MGVPSSEVRAFLEEVRETVEFTRSAFNMDQKKVKDAIRQQDSNTGLEVQVLTPKAAVVSKCRSAKIRVRTGCSELHPGLFVWRFSSAEWKIGTFTTPWSLWCARSCLSVVLVTRSLVLDCPLSTSTHKIQSQRGSGVYANFGADAKSATLAVVRGKTPPQVLNEAFRPTGLNKTMFPYFVNNTCFHSFMVSVVLCVPLFRNKYHIIGPLMRSPLVEMGLEHRL